MSKVYSEQYLPPCPDANKYALVKTEEGYYWRRKRGTVKPATLNRQMQQHAGLIKTSSPAASRLMARLQPFMQGFRKGKTYQKIAGLLLKTLKAKNVIDFSMLPGFELNYSYPLDKLLLCDYAVEEADGHLRVRMNPDGVAVKKQNTLATDYYFDLITVWGNAAADGRLQTRHTQSALYSFKDKNPVACELELPLPTAKPWMLILKVSCLEGNETGKHYKHYGMRVVRVST